MCQRVREVGTRGVFSGHEEGRTRQHKNWKSLGGSDNADGTVLLHLMCVHRPGIDRRTARGVPALAVSADYSNAKAPPSRQCEVVGLVGSFAMQPG